ncbi:MAG: chemotaxis protein CheD [Alphaproteobacteria bacterium]|nr:chemotaxis protein CheD [Alphaproteobacteria bacterium]
MQRQPAADYAGVRTVHVVQGQYRVTADPDEVLSTVLGSCVACCLRDPVAGIGGMNHFILPGDEGGPDSVKYGLNAMELLINALLQRGALRSRFEAKLFGGANVVQGLGNIGAKNSSFAVRFLESEGIRCVGQSLGGNRARRVKFWPATGRAIQMLLQDPGNAIFRSEQTQRPAVPAGDVDFF